MALETADVAYVPDVIPLPVLFNVFPVQSFAADFLTEIDRFKHRAVAEPTSSHVIYFPASRPLKKTIEGLNQVCAVDIVSHLLGLIAEHLVPGACDSASHQVSQETMKLRPRMVGPRQTPTTKASGAHSEIAAVFLNQQICGSLRGSK